MNRKERITLEMSILDCIVVLAEGNPGAVAALAELMKQSPTIDPDAAFGPLNPLLSLDSHGIYGSRIWMLWKDVCAGDPIKVLAIFRAYQLGQLAECTESAINHAIDNRGAGINHDAILKAVQKRLPKFGAYAVPEPLKEAHDGPSRPSIQDGPDPTIESR